MRDPANHPIAIFRRAQAQGKAVQIAGPMVRYSKLPLRQTIRALSPEDTTIVYSPMMLAREFVRNGTARATDFTTCDEDRPLIIQFGANNTRDMARAARMIQPHCDGISLNCGCPIRDQVKEGIGAALMTHPHRVAALIRAAKRACGEEFCVEAKIRIHTDLGFTVRFARIVEAAGADYITVHGRRQHDRSSVAVNLEAIRAVKQAVQIPVVANGDFATPGDLERIAEATRVDGVMSARGILANPGLFGGWETCPWRAVELLWDFAMASGMPFGLLHHHISEITASFITKAERKDMLSCRSTVELLDWFDERFELRRRTDPGFAQSDEWKRRQQIPIESQNSGDTLVVQPPLMTTALMAHS